ncbi:MAG: hypothetical protein L6R38_009531 [Xanthoria sp. 2 TBL-2021]|nr:MAG: hypothetical protein L6R38_009531 [Xanthoria sp. 2 TBL-2021]
MPSDFSKQPNSSSSANKRKDQIRGFMVLVLVRRMVQSLAPLGGLHYADAHLLATISYVDVELASVGTTMSSTEPATVNGMSTSQQNYNGVRILDWKDSSFTVLVLALQDVAEAYFLYLINEWGEPSCLYTVIRSTYSYRNSRSNKRVAKAGHPAPERQRSSARGDKPPWWRRDSPILVPGHHCASTAEKDATADIGADATFATEIHGILLKHNLLRIPGLSALVRKRYRNMTRTMSTLAGIDPLSVLCIQDYRVLKPAGTVRLPEINQEVTKADG